MSLYITSKLLTLGIAIKVDTLTLCRAMKVAILRMAAFYRTAIDREYETALTAYWQGKLDSYKEKSERQAGSIDYFMERMCSALGSLRETARVLIKCGAPYETVYNLIAPTFDGDGWFRYIIAKKLIPEGARNFDFTEECNVQFERIADRSLYCLELSRYGDIGYSYPHGYPRVARHSLRTTDKGYTNYRERLHELTLDKWLLRG